MDQLKMHMRARNLAYTTEKAYCYWVLRYIRYHNKRHPKTIGTEEISTFLSHLANLRQCSLSTQRLALNALIYLYREFLQIDITELNYKMSTKPRKLPAVFSSSEAAKVLGLLSGKYALAASLIYGSGLRISEVVALRIKDIDFEMNQIVVCSGKGGKDRTTLLPKSCNEPLKRQMAIVESMHNEDLANGRGSVYIPIAKSKAQLSSRQEFAWQYLFPSNAIIIDKSNNIAGRHHIDETVMRKQFKKAIRLTSINKAASSHTFRHSFATQCILNCMNIRALQELLGHASVTSTQLYLHVAEQKRSQVVSPLDVLFEVS
jgi:integron integrase